MADFQCKACGALFAVALAFDQTVESIKMCPVCGSGVIVLESDA